MHIWIDILNLACWAVCFLWMYRLSARQNSVLKSITEQGQRIERLSKEEHALIKEVHPAVGEIKEKVEEVAGVVQEATANGNQGTNSR